MQQICLGDNSNLYQENMTLGEVSRRENPSSGSPGTDNFRKNIECVYLEKQQILLSDNSNLVSGEHDHVWGGTIAPPPPVKRFTWYRWFSEKNLSWNILITGKFIFLKIQTLYQDYMTLEQGARRDFPPNGAPDTYDFRKKLWVSISRETADLSRWQFEPCIRRTWPWKRWHDGNPSRAILLVQTIFEKILSVYIWRNSRSDWLIYRTLYQRNLSMEKVAQPDAPSSGSPDTDDFRKNFELEYLENR